MAKVIHTPVVARGARRALPVERADSKVLNRLAAEGVEEPVATPKEPSIDAHEAERIMAECDASRQRAKTAEARLAEIQSELAALRMTAKEEGFEAGREEALCSAAEQRDAEAQRFADLCESLLEQQRQRVADAEEAAVEIGFAATVKLLGRLHSDNALLEALVRQSMEQVLEREGLTIYLSPKDCERMQAQARRNARDWDDIEFHADSRIQIGGCRIESRAGSLDARLELQIEELKKALLHTAKSSRSVETDDG